MPKRCITQQPQIITRRPPPGRIFTGKFSFTAEFHFFTLSHLTGICGNTVRCRPGPKIGNLRLTRKPNYICLSTSTRASGLAYYVNPLIKVLSMGRQKAVIKARREARRLLRRDSRSHKQREEESVTSLVHMSGVEAIGMARDCRDNSPVEARNRAQERYLQAIERKRLIFATGEAGCGKMFISAAKAAEALIHKDVERIIVTRPVLQADEDLGFLPGDITEKFAPYFRPVYDVLVRRLGASFMQYCLRPEIGKVEIAPFAYMRGRTFENAVVILDEAQNVTAAQMKMFLTRLGENVTVIVNGDITQCDLPNGIPSGLSDALARFEDDEMVGVVRFTKEDCVRSALCQRALLAYS
jgi:phosphate starvation-inducible PhoH-like protein